MVKYCLPYQSRIWIKSKDLSMGPVCLDVGLTFMLWAFKGIWDELGRLTIVMFALSIFIVDSDPLL